MEAGSDVAGTDQLWSGSRSGTHIPAFPHNMKFLLQRLRSRGAPHRDNPEPPDPAQGMIRLPLVFSLALAFVLLVPTACHKSDTRILVVGIDRTGVARTHSWSSEVATVTAGLVDEAFAAGTDELEMIGVGHDMNETGRVARVDLRLDCPTKDRCDEDRRRLRTQIAQVAGSVAASPVKGTGTALIEAFETAKDICAGHSCRVVMITDGQDSRVNQAASVDVLLAQIQPTFPQLRGVSVQLAGLGADGSSARAVARAERFWAEALRVAGAVDVRIGRSL